MIEFFGSTSLVQVGNNFYFYPVGGSSGPLFKYGGSPVVRCSTELGLQSGWSKRRAAIKSPACARARTSTRLWNTDSNGNCRFQLYRRRPVSGSSSVLKSLEPSFQQDLNGDGMIGSASPNDRDRVRSVRPAWCRSGNNFYFLHSRRQQRSAVESRRLAGRGGADTRLGSNRGGANGERLSSRLRMRRAPTSTRFGTPTAMATIISNVTGTVSRDRAQC